MTNYKEEYGKTLAKNAFDEFKPDKYDSDTCDHPVDWTHSTWYFAPKQDDYVEGLEQT